jgi:hypothetical protein
VAFLSRLILTGERLRVPRDIAVRLREQAARAGLVSGIPERLFQKAYMWRAMPSHCKSARMDNAGVSLPARHSRQLHGIVLLE